MEHTMHSVLFQPKTRWKRYSNIRFRTLDPPIACRRSNVITSSQRHRWTQRFSREKGIGGIIISPSQKYKYVLKQNTNLTQNRTREPIKGHALPSIEAWFKTFFIFYVYKQLNTFRVVNLFRNNI